MNRKLTTNLFISFSTHSPTITWHLLVLLLQFLPSHPSSIASSFNWIKIALWLSPWSLEVNKVKMLDAGVPRRANRMNECEIEWVVQLLFYNKLLSYTSHSFIRPFIQSAIHSGSAHLLEIFFIDETKNVCLLLCHPNSLFISVSIQGNLFLILIFFLLLFFYPAHQRNLWVNMTSGPGMEENLFWHENINLIYYVRSFRWNHPVWFHFLHKYKAYMRLYEMHHLPEFPLSIAGA